MKALVLSSAMTAVVVKDRLRTALHTFLVSGLLAPTLALAASAAAKPPAPEPAPAKVAVAGETKATANSGAKPAAAPAVRGSRQDPLDVLRDRLKSRLGATTVPVPDAAAARAVQVSSRATGEFQVPANALARGSHASRPTAKPSTTNEAEHGHESADAGASAHGHWTYTGAAGPEQWGRLKPEFSLCGRGQRQSPIDIRDGFAVELEPVEFDYRPSRFQVTNSGHSLQADMAPGNRITISGRSFELVQFHFHNPAEERINGRSFAMSGHLVHKDAEGRLAVVTVLFDRGAANPTVQTVWNHLPLEVGVAEPGRLEINPADLLPKDQRYFTYMGSLTTPPCTEGVQWVVLKVPVTLSNAQHDFFARLYPMNARPLQAASGRIIKQSQ